MVECVFCDSPATNKDRDLDMWLCRTHFEEMNGTIVDVEFNEIW